MKSSLATKRNLPDRLAAAAVTFPVLLNGGLSVFCAPIPVGGRDDTEGVEMVLPRLPS